MDILIRTDSSHDIGSGHVMRMLAITEELIDKGHKVIFCSSGMLPQLKNRIVGAGAEITNIICKIGSTEDIIQTLKVSEKLQINTVIIDGYHFNEEYLAAINEKYAAVFFDDEAKLKTISANIVINGSPFAFEVPYNEIAKKSVLLLGPEYILLRKEFRLKGLNLLPLRSRNNILITFGGTDPLELTFPVIQELLSKVDKDQKIDVVVNNDPPFTLPDQVTIHKNCNYMADLMQHAEFAISAGGTTIAELAYMQVPTLLVIVADNQEKHALWAKENAINIVIDARKSAKDKTAKMIGEQSLRIVKDFKFREDLVKNNRVFNIGEGAVKIAKKISSI